MMTHYFKRISLFLVLLFACTHIFGQEWSKEDSIWLQKVLEGKETLKINEDTKKAIEDGRLKIPAWMKDFDPNSEFELSKDFDDAEIPDSLRIRRFDIFSMPPAVCALYVLYMERIDSTYQLQSLMISGD